MKRFFWITLCLCVTLNTLAQKQQGIVRTIGRPGKPSAPVGNVTIRWRGMFNAVISNSDGQFSVAMPGKKDGDEIVLWDGEPSMILYETPGHNPGCMVMCIGDMLFTGDAYIPGIGANTQVPRSNKEQAKQSLERIMELAKGKKVFPGHLV